MTQPCPRQTNEAVMRVQKEHRSHWTDDGRCSYCGSISNDDFMLHVESGCTVTPTDKTYKVYIDVPNESCGALTVTGAASTRMSQDWITPDEMSAEQKHALDESGYVDDLFGERFYLFGKEGATRHEKFYFQHLTMPQMRRFVELLNEKKIKLAYPGRFYVAPFFITYNKRKAMV